jgi:Ca2+-binding EF-hand superfamily protein
MAAIPLSDLPALPNSKVLMINQIVHNEEFSSQLASVERKFGATIYAMRIRLVEVFQDFDPMRSGLMTQSRFVRCVTAALERAAGHQLTKHEIDALIKEYTVPKTKMIRWKDFVKKMDKGFRCSYSL